MGRPADIEIVMKMSKSYCMSAMESLFSNPGLDLVTDMILENLSCHALASLEMSSPVIARYFIREHVWKRQWDKISSNYLLPECHCREDISRYNNVEDEAPEFMESISFRSLCHHYLCGLPEQWRKGKPIVGGINTATGWVFKETALVGTYCIALSFGGYLHVAKIVEGLNTFCGKCMQRYSLIQASSVSTSVHLQIPSRHLLYRTNEGWAVAMAAHQNILLVADSIGALTWWYVDNSEWSELCNVKVPHSESIKAVAVSVEISLSLCYQSHQRTINVWKMHWQDKKTLSQGK